MSRLVYLIVSAGCPICVDAILELRNLDGTSIIIDSKMLDFFADDDKIEDMVDCLKDTAKRWHDVSDRILKNPDELSSKYKDTSRIKKRSSVVPYLISFEDDDSMKEDVGSSCVDWIKEHSSKHHKK